MNRLSLVVALGLGVGAPHSPHGFGPAEHARAVPRTAADASTVVQGPAANGDASSAWEASYAAEAAGKLEAALRALDGLPAARHVSYLADLRRGWLQYRLGRYLESVSAYRYAVSKEPAAIEARVALLLPLMALTKWQDVTQVAQDVLKIDPDNYLATQRLALAKFNTARFQEAEGLYRRLLLLYPSDLEMRAGLGWSLLRLGKHAQASAAFSQVLEVNRYHESATRGLQLARAQP